jgi:hypothetical protein
MTWRPTGSNLGYYIYLGSVYKLSEGGYSSDSVPLRLLVALNVAALALGLAAANCRAINPNKKPDLAVS